MTDKYKGKKKKNIPVSHLGLAMTWLHPPASSTSTPAGLKSFLAKGCLMSLATINLGAQTKDQLLQIQCKAETTVQISVNESRKRELSRG